MTLNNISSRVLPQYLSGLNKCFELSGLQPPFPANHAARQLLKGARRLLPHQARPAQPLPPELIVKLLKLGLTTLNKNHLCAATAVICATITGLRGHTLAQLPTQHVTITDEQILVRIDNEKSRHVRSGEPKRTIVYYRTPYNDVVFKIFKRFQRIAQPQANASYFRLPSDPKILPSSTLDSYVRSSLALLQQSAPGRSGHSLRHTFASMTRSINVTLEKICYVGGWSITGNAVHTYIDPTYPDHPVSYLLFNGLLPPSSRLSVAPRTILGQ